MNIQDTTKRIIDKGLSGRFISLTSIVLTYCIVMIATLCLVAKKLVDWEMFYALFGPFALLAKDVVSHYFNREDRFKPKEIEDDHKLDKSVLQPGG